MPRLYPQYAHSVGEANSDRSENRGGEGTHETASWQTGFRVPRKGGEPSIRPREQRQQVPSYTVAGWDRKEGPCCFLRPAH